MQDIEFPSTSEMAVMDALSQFRYMTTQHLVRLGVSPSLRHVQRVLRNLKRRRFPLVGALDFGSIPTIGRLHSLHYLTERGATVLEDAGRPWETIKWPQRVRVFPHDYWHRVNCIDFHVSLELWARANSATVEPFHAYYDHGKVDASGRAHPRSRVAWMDESLVPDAVFMMTPSDGISRLCAFEMHNGTDTARLTPKLKTYVKACRERAIETPYDFSTAARVLFVFDNAPTLQRLRNRVERDNLLQGREAQFFAKTLDEVASDFRSGWWPFDGRNQRDLF